MKTIDLSHHIYNGAPFYPTDPPIRIIEEKRIDKDNTLLHSIHFGTHSGTHLDVPAHVIERGKRLSDFSLNAFFGLAIKLDKMNYNQINKQKEMIDAVIFDTDWYKNIHVPDTFFGKDRPKIPTELLQIIIKNNIKIFGCDLPSVDASGSKDKPVHKTLLGNDVIIYESLTNLNQLPMLVPFQFYGFPLSLKDLDGSPVRAVALID